MGMECVVRGIPFHYQEFGEGRPILMIHGGGADHRHMVSAFEPLFEGREGWKRIYPDLPGMGRTPGATWMENQDHVLEVLRDFTNHVIPDQPFAAVGASYGGFLLQGLVYLIPERLLGAAFIVPSLDDVEQRQLPDQVILVRDAALLSELENEEAELLQSVATVQSRDLWEYFRINVLPAREIADFDFLKRVATGLTYSFDPRKLSPPFEKPVLFFTGKQDCFR